VNTQPTPEVNRNDVVRVIRRDFPGLSEGDILAVLDLYGKASWERERDRVQLAILKLADGDLKALKRHTEAACCDYRDILAPAEYPKHSKLGWSARSTRGEFSKIYEDDWNHYQQWLTRK
jgi:hypothetical protein